MDFQRVNTGKNIYSEKEIYDMLKNKKTFYIALGEEYEKDVAHCELLLIKRNATETATSSVINMNKHRIDETLEKLIHMYEEITYEENSLYISILKSALGVENALYVLSNNIRYNINYETNRLTIN